MRARSTARRPADEPETARLTALAAALAGVHNPVGRVPTMIDDSLLLLAVQATSSAPEIPTAEASGSGGLPLILVIAGLTLLASFVCSLFEAVLYSLTPTQVELLKRGQSFGADRLAALRAKIEEPIAAILTINTIAHTAGASVCGSLVGTYFGNAAVGVFTAIFTVAVLAFTEIVPKSLGVRFAQGLGPLIAWPLQVMVWTSWPVAKASRWLMHKLTGGKNEAAPSADEILLMTRLARASGEIRELESKWVVNALRLDNVTAAELMTPRTVVDTLPAELTIGELRQRIGSIAHTRLPVTEGDSLDSIIGFVHLRSLLEASAHDRHSERVKDLATKLEFVPESFRGDELLTRMLRDKLHLVAVIDEYGGFEGIVTLEDVLECLLGMQIVDEHDRHTDLKQVARERAESKLRSALPRATPSSDPN